MTLRQIIPIALTTIVCSSAAFAQGRSGDVYDFLDRPTSSRAMALGSTHAVVGTDEIGFAFMNPSAISDTMHQSIGLQVATLPGHIVQGSAIYGHYVERLKGTVAIGALYVNYGSFDWTDENGNELGDFSAQDAALHLTYSRAIAPQLQMAATIKPIFSKLHQYSSFGLAMDLGATYKSKSGRFKAGIVVRNIGAQLKRYDSNEMGDLNTDMRIGFSIMPEHAPFRFTMSLKDIFHWDLSIDRQRKINAFDNILRHTAMGIEFIPHKTIFVAFGYNQRMRRELRESSTGGMAGFSWGVGFRAARIDISYAMMKYHIAGASNSLTLSTNLNRFLKR